MFQKTITFGSCAVAMLALGLSACTTTVKTRDQIVRAPRCVDQTVQIYFEPDSAEVTKEGRAVLNLAANYTVNQYTTVFGRIDNLLNERYQNPTGFDRPGLGVFGGVRIVNR